MKTIEVTFYATKYVRMEHRTVISVPDDFTQFDIEQAADTVYSLTPTGLFDEYNEDPNWERETTLIGKDNSGKKPDWEAKKTVGVHGASTTETINVVKHKE